MKMSQKTVRGPITGTLALCLGFGLPIAAQTGDGIVVPTHGADALVASDFMGLELPDIFFSASGRVEPMEADRTGHIGSAVFESDAFDAAGLIEADFFDAAETAFADFQAQLASAMTDPNLVRLDSEWASVDDPTTTISCWHETLDGLFLPVTIECRSWTEERPLVVSITIEDVAFENLLGIQDLLRQGHDMLRIAWFALEEDVL